MTIHEMLMTAKGRLGRVQVLEKRGISKGQAETTKTRNSAVIMLKLVYSRMDPFSTMKPSLEKLFCFLSKNFLSKF